MDKKRIMIVDDEVPFTRLLKMSLEQGGRYADSLLTDYVPPARRARAMSLLSIGALVGMGGGVIYGGWASEQLGWRLALVSVGVPGALLALVFLLTVDDLPRRAADAPASDAFSGKSLGGVLWQLAHTPAFVWLTLGATFVTIVAMGRNFWEPTFLLRVYGMDPAEAGLWYAVISPVPAALGTWICASITDRLAARDRRRYGWFPAAGQDKSNGGWRWSAVLLPQFRPHPGRFREAPGKIP